MDKGGCFVLALFLLAVLIALFAHIQGGNAGAVIVDQRGLALVDRGLASMRVCLCVVCGLAGEPSALPSLLAH